MSTLSTVAAAKAAIVAALSARAALADVDVHYAYPGESAFRERIFLGNEVLSKQKAAAQRTGAKPREETYELPLVIETLQPGKTPEETEARLGVLGDEVAAVLETWPTLGVAGVNWMGIGDDIDWGVYRRDTGCIGRLTVAVDVRARL